MRRPDPNIGYHRAKMGGRVVTLLRSRISDEMAPVQVRYTGPSIDEFSRRLSAFKRLWQVQVHVFASIALIYRSRHPNVAQLEGYSDGRLSGSRFFVLKGGKRRICSTTSPFYLVLTLAYRFDWLESISQCADGNTTPFALPAHCELIYLLPDQTF